MSDAFLAVAGNELRGALRGRMVPGFATLFGALALVVALGGLGASGQLLVQGFTRTAVSLLNLSLYLLPLLGLLLGATAFAPREDGTELMLAQPIGRTTALLGRFAGLVAALGLVAGAGFGATGLLVAARTGTAGIGGYLAIAAAATAVGVAGLGCGLLAGVAARRRATAVAAALAAWFLAAILYDLAAIALLQLAGAGEAGPGLLALLALNPIDGARTLGLITLGGELLLGPTGAALEAFAGGGGRAWIVASLLAWATLPLVGASMVFRRRDF